MNKSELAKSIYSISHLTGSFLLRSGQTSSEYFDKYRFSSNPVVLKAIADHMVKMIPSDTEYLAGLEMGAIPIATALSMASGIPAIFVRKKAKEYGTCQFAEGAEINNKRLLVIEDVVTSGGQLITSTEDLRKAGAHIDHALCVILREPKAASILLENKIKLNALFTMDELKNSAL